MSIVKYHESHYVAVLDRYELVELVVVAVIVSSLAVIVVQRPISYFGKKL